ncbi:uncharacterized protein Z519_07001 [Cladophialophora bantiana CBS 173.52]|uniref:Mannosyltransferase n=1 Tax=Cladophialophora bantiana (strain ATCC 10958 / CBS 173.52 / CDC B-1940 / NIH 8579) TaxID=1442370 RepID=A0A0D2I591_CLAB1|nr:uncharacterized protein Z519_07001 [Cladophialophora bantiana CBS 173.52]KIW92019.1 hypothetical protein Z519_07001 [Cladophialophora bantiana CBS 173.52]
MGRLELWQSCYLLFPFLVLCHLYVSPYTKVEESFNVQAAHDILKYGIPTHNANFRFRALYDHMTFPGAVPRTFIGAIVLAAIAKPMVWCGGLEGAQQQMLVRSILGLFNAAALIYYASGVKRAYGRTAAVWYTIHQASQFHVWYYSSRTLPNMFAFGMSTFAFALLLPVTPSTTDSLVKRNKLALYTLTLAAVIFRSEVGLLLGCQCLYMLLRRGLNASIALSLIRRILVPAILTATITGLILTVCIDTFFWQSPNLLWPELAAFLSNVFPPTDGLGASAWGTSPWYWYFTDALPRLLMNPFVVGLLPASFIYPSLRASNLDLIIPSLGYVSLYSFLAHKETRFLFPVIPPLTAAIARGSDYVYKLSPRYPICFIFATFIILTTTCTAALSHFVFLPLSAQTYPGAHALSSLHAISLNYPPQPVVRVHLTNLALQTGVTHFLSTPSFTNSSGHGRPVFYLPGSASGDIPALVSPQRTKWVYDKSDNETEFLSPIFWARFDYVVVEDPGRVIGRWDVVDKVPSLGRLQIMPPDVGRGMLVLGHTKEESREDDGLARLVGEVYGRKMKWMYGVVHDLLREGYGLDKVLGKRASWTNGWWVHWGLETRLYILKRVQGGIIP